MVKIIMKEELATIVEIRKGRHIYIRKVVIGGNKNDSDCNTAATCTGGSYNNNDMDDDGATAPTKHIQLLFVHGICGTEQQFQLLIQSMHDELVASSSSSQSSSSSSSLPLTITCWLYDQIGCGQSLQPSMVTFNDCNYQETRDDFKAVLLYIEQQQQNQIYNVPIQSSSTVQIVPTVLVGHSYGPSIFIPLLSDPDILLLPNLMGLILINTSVRCKYLPLSDGGHVIMRLPTVVLQCIQSQLTEAFIKMAIHPKHTELQNIIRTSSQQNNMVVAQSYHRHSKWMSMLQLQQVVFHVRRRHCSSTNNTPSSAQQQQQQQNILPTLLIHGIDDGVTPVECAQYMYNQLVGTSHDHNENDNHAEALAHISFITIEDASHMTMIEQPQQTAHAILNFIVQNLW